METNNPTFEEEMDRIINMLLIKFTDRLKTASLTFEYAQILLSYLFGIGVWTEAKILIAGKGANVFGDFLREDFIPIMAGKNGLVFTGKVDNAALLYDIPVENTYDVILFLKKPTPEEIGILSTFLDENSQAGSLVFGFSVDAIFSNQEKEIYDVFIMLSDAGLSPQIPQQMPPMIIPEEGGQKVFASAVIIGKK